MICLYVIIKAIAIQSKEEGALMYTKNVQNIAQKANRLALNGRTRTEVLLQHMKDHNILNHGCSVKPQVHF